MNIKESINHGLNLLAISIVGLAGFAFLPEAFVESDVPDKIDDILLFILGAVGIWWYKKSNNRYTQSLIPVIFVGLALIIKIIGLIIEHDDAESIGDDIGGLILFVLGFGIVWNQYKTNMKLLAEAK